MRTTTEVVVHSMYCTVHVHVGAPTCTVALHVIAVSIVGWTRIRPSMRVLIARLFNLERWPCRGRQIARQNGACGASPASHLLRDDTTAVRVEIYFAASALRTNRQYLTLVFSSLYVSATAASSASHCRRLSGQPTPSVPLTPSSRKRQC